MFKHHLKTSIRNLLKGKLFTAINVTGLAVGMACFTVLALFVIDELNFDRFYEKSDNIYRLYTDLQVNGETEVNSKVGLPLGPALQRDFPEVIDFTRMSQFIDPVFRYGDKAFREWSIWGVDPGFLRIFSVKMLEGDRETALELPNSIVLTESMARKYFADDSALGKTLATEDGGGFVVTGVIEDFPSNTHMNGDFFIPISNDPDIRLQNWISHRYTTYIILRDGVDPEAFRKKMNETVINNYIGPQFESLIDVNMDQFVAAGNRYRIGLQPLKSIYLESKRKYGIDENTEWNEFRMGDINYIYLFSAAAVFILIIAILNFVNLSTARSEKRSREVGVRKTIGAGRFDLAMQFMFESILISIGSALISLILSELFLPIFNQLTGKSLSIIQLINPIGILFVVTSVLLIGILNGLYPSLFLSSFRPAQVLKSGGGKSDRKSVLRSVLVVFQFSISIVLLIGSLLIKKQIDYMSHKDLGFNKEHLVIVYQADVNESTQQVVKREFLGNSHVKAATFCSEMFRNGIPGNGYIYEDIGNSSPILAQYVDADYDFINTYGITMKEGRYFDKNFSADEHNVVVNEAFYREQGLADPLGKTMQRIVEGDVDPTAYRIIGVISDFNYESLHRNIRPLVIHLNPAKHNQILTLRLDSENMSATFAYLKKTWKQVTGNENFYYRFVDANLQRLYENERKVQLTASFFSCLAIFIACLGLYGNAVFITEQKTKEVGIRKVLGASVVEITIQLSKQFSKWVILANIIAWPITYYLISQWLNDFAYRIEIGWSVFIVAGFVSLITALLTVSYQTIRASLSNPIKALKYE